MDRQNRAAAGGSLPAVQQTSETGGCAPVPLISLSVAARYGRHIGKSRRKGTSAALRHGNVDERKRGAPVVTPNTQARGLRTRRSRNRLKSRSAVHSSRTPWC